MNITIHYKIIIAYQINKFLHMFILYRFHVDQVFFHKNRHGCHIPESWWPGVLETQLFSQRLESSESSPFMAQHFRTIGQGMAGGKMSGPRFQVMKCEKNIWVNLITTSLFSLTGIMVYKKNHPKMVLIQFSELL